jgi:hypothetical protein
VIRLDKDHPAIIEGRSLYPNLVRDPGEGEWVLKSGEHNRKLGSHVTKKRWKGFPIFSLSLEERATCPRSCSQWSICYGNHASQFKAYRYRHGPDLEAELERELFILSTEVKTRRGFVVRLHALGDFYSVDYVNRWAGWLDRFPALRCFGYTAWPPDTDIGKAVLRLANAQWNRFAIRLGNGEGDVRTTSVIGPGDERPHPSNAIVCPAETAASEKQVCCGTCALCWTTEKKIVFIEH